MGAIARGPVICGASEGTSGERCGAGTETRGIPAPVPTTGCWASATAASADSERIASARTNMTLQPDSYCHRICKLGALIEIEQVTKTLGTRVMLIGLNQSRYFTARIGGHGHGRAEEQPKSPLRPCLGARRLERSLPGLFGLSVSASAPRRHSFDGVTGHRSSQQALLQCGSPRVTSCRKLRDERTSRGGRNSAAIDPKATSIVAACSITFDLDQRAANAAHHREVGTEVNIVAKRPALVQQAYLGTRERSVIVFEVWDTAGSSQVRLGAGPAKLQSLSDRCIVVARLNSASGPHAADLVCGPAERMAGN